MEKYKIVDEKTNCWNWNGNLDRKGYGKIGVLVNGIQKTIQVHRFALLVYKNIELTKFDTVCHQCHNRKCFNPAHLKISTQFNNVLERLKDWEEFKNNNEAMVNEYLLILEKIKKEYFEWHKKIG